MGKSILRLIVAGFFFYAVVNLQAQVTAVGHVTAEVVASLTATEIAPMSFGQFSPESGGGQISLTPQGSTSSTGTVNVVGGSHNPGSFSVNGEPGAVISIQLPSAPSTLTNFSTSGTMTVTSWISDPPQQGSTTIPASGAREVKVGATLIVGTIHNNPIGMYSGTYNITFNYN